MGMSRCIDILGAGATDTDDEVEKGVCVCITARSEESSPVPAGIDRR